MGEGKRDRMKQRQRNRGEARFRFLCIMRWYCWLLELFLFLYRVVFPQQDDFDIKEEA